MVYFFLRYLLLETMCVTAAEEQ